MRRSPRFCRRDFSNASVKLPIMDCVIPDVISPARRISRCKVCYRIRKIIGQRFGQGLYPVCRILCNLCVLLRVPDCFCPLSLAPGIPFLHRDGIRGYRANHFRLCCHFHTSSFHQTGDGSVFVHSPPLSSLWVCSSSYTGGHDSVVTSG